MCEEKGIDSELVPRIATGFCGGMARSGNMCGAVTGAIMAINIAFGRDVADDPRDEDYAAVRALLDRFEGMFGSTDCGELLGCDLDTPEGRDYYKEKDLARECKRLTEVAARMAMELSS